jgi:DNA polymerase I-like protein with 3'-5' exonuclease and polymerase domains
VLPPVSDCLWFDCETTGLNPLAPDFRVRGVGWLDGRTEEHAFLSLDNWDGDMEVLDHFQELLTSRHLFAHNLHYDLLCAHRLGLSLPPYQHWNCTETLVKLADPRQGLFKGGFSLKPLGARLFGLDATAEDVALKAWCKAQKPKVLVEDRFVKAPVELLEPYCLQDVALCAKLWTVYKNKLTGPVLTAYQEEMELLGHLIAAELRGLHLRLDEVASVRVRLRDLITQHEQAIYTLNGGAPFNTGSGPQLAAALYKKKVPAKFTKGGSPSTAKDALYKIAGTNEMASKVLKLRGCEKLLDYCDEFDKYRRGAVLSGIFHSLGAVTGRMSSSNPNLQNIPRTDERSATLIRAMFDPHPGRGFVAADFSQIELRIGALYTDDANMLKILREGGDIHASTAVLMFGESTKTFRQIAKTINFLIFYGGTADKLVETLAAFGTYITYAQAFEYIAAWHRAFPRVRKFFDKASSEVALDGGVRDLLGRFYPVPRNEAYKAVNYLIQGTCARILKGAICRLAPVLPQWDAHMVSFIHDEILIDAPAEHCQVVTLPDGSFGAPAEGLLADVCSAMEAQLHPAITVKTPVEVSVCPENWAKKQKVAQWLPSAQP